MRCVLVPQPDFGYFQVQLVRGADIIDVQPVKTLDAAYPIARAWQVEHGAQYHATSAAA
jgi:hypothetical protein